MYFSRLCFICLSLLFTACGGLSPKKVADPSNLTIDSAMASVGRGFYNMHQELGGRDTRKDIQNAKPVLTSAEQEANRVKLGLWGCKVITTLNVTANATNSSDLVLDLSAKAPVEVVDASLSAKGDFKKESTGNRVNTITIEMYSAACLPKDTLGYDKPDKVIDAVEGLTIGVENGPMRKNIDQIQRNTPTR